MRRGRPHDVRHIRFVFWLTLAKVRTPSAGGAAWKREVTGPRDRDLSGRSGHGTFFLSLRRMTTPPAFRPRRQSVRMRGWVGPPHPLKWPYSIDQP